MHKIPAASSNFGESSVVKIGSGKSLKNCFKRLATICGSCSYKYIFSLLLYWDFKWRTLDFNPDILYIDSQAKPKKEKESLIGRSKF